MNNEFVCTFGMCFPWTIKFNMQGSEMFITFANKISVYFEYIMCFFVDFTMLITSLRKMYIYCMNGIASNLQGFSFVSSGLHHVIKWQVICLGRSPWEIIQGSMFAVNVYTSFYWKYGKADWFCARTYISSHELKNNPIKLTEASNAMQVLCLFKERVFIFLLYQYHNHVLKLSGE